MFKLLLAVLLTISGLTAQAGAFGTFAWRGHASIEFRNGQLLFILVGTGTPYNVVGWNGMPAFQLRAAQAGVIENRSCIAGSYVYLHPTDEFDQTYEARFGPLAGAGVFLAGHDSTGSYPFPPLQADLYEYSLSYCTVWNSGGPFQGPCGEGPSCGSNAPATWAVVFEIH